MVREATPGAPPKYSEDDLEHIAEQAVREREALGKPQRASVWRRLFGSRKRPTLVGQSNESLEHLAHCSIGPLAPALEHGARRGCASVLYLGLPRTWPSTPGRNSRFGIVGRGDGDTLRVRSSLPVTLQDALLHLIRYMSS
jgi:hypothetical protein